MPLLQLILTLTLTQKIRLHFAAGCTTGCKNVYILRPVVQLVVQLVVQPVVKCKHRVTLTVNPNFLNTQYAVRNRK